MSNWEYKGYYKQYDMDGEIHIGTGLVKVHDIFNPLPDFMRRATVLFSDPPESQGNIKSFYTKADKTEVPFFEAFRERFFAVVDEIAPHTAYIEVFKRNKPYFLEQLQKRYEHVMVADNTYYHKADCKCWIICASHKLVDEMHSAINGIDEQEAIETICKTLPESDTICDCCMGQGLVGYYANKYGKPFLGTELNKKRLAVMIERINKGTLKC